MKLIKRYHNSSGYSLAEVLIAILILLMVSSVVAGGVPAAVNAYRKVTLSANAQMVLSTAVTMMKSELGTASADTVKWDKTTNTIKYKSSKYGSIWVMDGKKDHTDGTDGKDLVGITIRPDPDDPSVSAESRRLVSAAASPNGLYVTFDLQSSKGEDTPTAITIDKIKVCANGYDEPLAELDKLVVRLM